MSSLDRLVDVGSYTRSQAEPFVADVLYRLGQQFTCQSLWERKGISYYYRGYKLQAAPLPPDAEAGFGYGRRTGSAMHVDAHADVALGEYTWFASKFDVSQGQPDGVVKLQTSMHVTFGIPKGTDDQFWLSDNDVRNGMLCWADAYRLPNRKNWTCIQLRTFVGDIWLRPVGPRSGLPLGTVLAQKGSSLINMGHHVVRLAESVCVHPVKLHPWGSLATNDESGRVWIIDQSDLSFDATLRLEVVGRYNDRLYDREHVTLKPPYEVVWSPAHNPSLLIPLVLK